MGYKQSTSVNVLLAESRKSTLLQRWSYLAGNFIAKVWSWENHPLKSILENITDTRDTPTFIERNKKSILVSTFESLVGPLRIVESCPTYVCLSKNWLSFILLMWNSLEENSLKNLS